MQGPGTGFSSMSSAQRSVALDVSGTARRLRTRQHHRHEGNRTDTGRFHDTQALEGT
jgi:hypothetical protein